MTIQEAEAEKRQAEQEIAIILAKLQDKTGLFIDDAYFRRTASGLIYLEIKICV